MPETFVCADLHFNHKNIIAYENRPWPDREAMNQGLIANWNAVVNPEDTVYVLGDVGFCSTSKLNALVSQLNGHKILIRGNHDRDRSLSTWITIGFEDAHDWFLISCMHQIVRLQHEPPEDKEEDIFYLYGHVHGNPDFPDWTPDSACVSIERLNYAPAKLEDVISGAAYAHRK